VGNYHLFFSSGWLGTYLAYKQHLPQLYGPLTSVVDVVCSPRVIPDLTSNMSSSSNKSDPQVGVLETTASPTEKPPAVEVDNAWGYLDHHRDADLLNPVDIDKLRKKIDWRIIPVMFCAYTIQFLDKIILNVSRAVEGARLA